MKRILAFLVLASCAFAGTWMAAPGKGSHAAAGGGALAIANTFTATQAHVGSGNDGSMTISVTGAPAGSLLVVTAQNEGDSSIHAAFTISDSSTLTWTKRADAQAASSGNAEIWTAPFAAGGSTTVTVSCVAGGVITVSMSAVCYVVTGQETTPAGAAPTPATAQNAPSLSITTTRANSIIFCVSSDWAAQSAVRTYRTPSSISPTTALEWITDAGTATCGYHYWYQATTAQAYVIGMTSPGAQDAGTCAYEVRTP